jgi:hypothetical protein
MKTLKGIIVWPPGTAVKASRTVSADGLPLHNGILGSQVPCPLRR